MPAIVRLTFFACVASGGRVAASARVFVADAVSSIGGAVMVSPAGWFLVCCGEACPVGLAVCFSGDPAGAEHGAGNAHAGLCL